MSALRPRRRSSEPHDLRPEVATIGIEWCTEQSGGLNRYVWDLHGALERYPTGRFPRAFVIGGGHA
jgi:hypothetical protein